MAEEKYIKRRKRGAVVYTPIAVLLIGIILIFGISVFFRVSVIDVTGANRYSAERILSASGLKKGDNLIFVDAGAAANKVAKTLPYLNEVIIEKIIPDKVVIRVTESQPIAVLKYNGNWWILDQKARALEQTDVIDAAGKINISGIEPVSLAEGLVIKVDESQETKLQYLTQVLGAINDAGLSGQVGQLDISNIGNITFTYTDRFTVIMSGGEDADYKLSLMQNVIEQLEPDEKGKIKIDLSAEIEARFIPS
jgi:cell division protein FtsQ